MYLPQQIEFLQKNYPLMRLPELTAAFNARFGAGKTEGQIKSTLQNHRIKSGRPRWKEAGTYYRIYTREQEDFIRDNFKTHTVRDLTAAFNVRFPDNSKTVAQIDSFIGNRKIKSGRTGRFKKGHKPFNAGIKGLTGANITSFKKGHKPPNWKPLGTERICSKDGYLLVKVAQKNPYTGSPTRYRLKHVVLWEKRYGTVPPGKIVVFKDGDKRNIRITNLMLVSREELLRLNHHHYKEAPPELKPAILALAKLEVRMFSLRNRG